MSFATGDKRAIGRKLLEFPADFPGLRSRMMRPTFHSPRMMLELMERLMTAVR